VIWDTGVANAIDLHTGIERAFTVRNNLYEAGETGYLGANALTVRSAPFVNFANKNFDPAGSALRAGHDGTDVGATINWSCDTSESKSQSRPLPPKLSAESG
jgi:hypothetical protein